jgi:hypothetical protein
VICLRTSDGPSVPCDLRLIYTYSMIVHSLIQRTMFLVLLVVGCISAQQASAQGLQPDNGQHSVRGIVVNSVTHEPIGRALVSSSNNRFAMLTDSEGHFEFTLPKVDSENESGFAGDGQPLRMMSLVGAGTFPWLMARKPGFLDDPNQGRQVEASPGSELTISLMPEALIQGRVLLSPTDPAFGVNVQIFSRQVQEGIPRWIPGISVQANSNGEFRFAELLPGSYKLVTHELMDNDPAATDPGGQLYGFPPVYHPSVTDFAAASTIQLTAGQTFHADISLVRQPYYPVRIPVLNGDANSGMNITVSPQRRRSPGYSLGYNAEKQRIEGLLPNGSYLVEVATSGPNAASGAVNIAVAGVPVDGPGMTLTGNNSISVHVKEEFSATDWNGSGSTMVNGRTILLRGPRLYLQVIAEAADDFEQRGGWIRPPTGPNDDSLVIENLASGRYWLRLSSSRGYVAAATMGGVDLLHEPFVVAGGSSTPIEITMRDDNAEIEGTVAGITTGATAAGGQAYPSAYSGPTVWTQSAFVYCVPLPDSPGQFLQLAASSDGKFEYGMVAPGTYRVMAFRNAQPNLAYRDPEAIRAYETKGEVVHLSAGQKVNIQLQIISGSD